MAKNIAAFFDIDGTIYRDGLIIEVFKKMVTHEIISESRWTDEVKPAFMAWVNRQGDYEIYLDKVVNEFKEATKGLSSEHINFIAKKVIEQKGDRVYQFTRNAIQRHRRSGHKIIAISGSPDCLVDLMAAKYKFDDWRGTIYHTDENGYYNGKITPMWDSKSKQKALKSLAEEYDLDLAECYSYGDTNGDFTMFKLTGHPTAVNPTKELLTNILNDNEIKNKINIVVERKDVVYNLDIKNLNFK